MGGFTSKCKRLDIQDGLSQIHLAAKRGDTEAVRNLLMSSVNANILDTKHNTPLHWAAMNGHVDVINLLLNSGHNANARNSDGDIPLHLASRNGHLEVVKLLLRNNADVNVRNASGSNPVHVSAELGNVEIVKTLIDHQSKVNAVDSNGNTALHLAASNGHSNVVNVLLAQVDVNVDNANDQLSYSSTFDTDVNVISTQNHLLAEHGSSDIKEHFIPDVNVLNNDKMTPLHLACENGHTSIVEILLDNHARVDVMMENKDSPLFLAALNGHAGVTDLLLRRRIFDFAYSYSAQWTPLHVAVEEGWSDVAELILKHSRMIYEKLTEEGLTLRKNAKRGVIPVEFTSGEGRRVFAEVAWIELITPLEIERNAIRSTPLAYAALQTDPITVQLLLSEVDSMYSQADIVDSFLSIVCGIRELSDEALSISREYNSNFRTVLRFLMDSNKFDVNHQDQICDSFLHAVMGSIYQYNLCGCLNKKSKLHPLLNKIESDVFQMLLEKGADFNVKNSDGETPLIIAAKKGRCDVIQTLFDWEKQSGMKLNLDAKDHFGATALIKAVQWHRVSVVRLLLKHNASLNCYDYNGSTALHAAVYDPNTNWSEFNFFFKQYTKRKFDNKKYSLINCNDDSRKQDFEYKNIIEMKGNILEHRKETKRIREEIVTLLLANDATNVNAIDFRGNTPLDLAVKSSKQITSATLRSLKNRGAIHNLLKVDDQTLTGEEWVDERGQNPLHRLIIFLISSNGILVGHKMFQSVRGHHLDDIGDIGESDASDKIFDVVLRRLKSLREMVTETDDKGRTPLHYAVVNPSMHRHRDLVNVLLEKGAKVNANDRYGKTPLHYVEDYGDDDDVSYKLFVQYGADEDAKDEDGHTPRDLQELRSSVIRREADARESTIGRQELYVSNFIDFKRELDINRCTELTKRKFVENIRILSQSPRHGESPEEAIWKIWSKNEFICLNRRLSKLEPLIHKFIKRLANGIKEQDWRFECQPTLVGSAREETKICYSGDFDFNFNLILIGQLCDAFPHSLGPKGYFQLGRKFHSIEKNSKAVQFDSFFNSDHCLLTNEVNSRFQIILDEVLRNHNFWQNEHLFEMHLNHEVAENSDKPVRMCKNLNLRMIRPIEDGEGGFLFVNISVDIVACIHVDDWLSEDPLPFCISSVLNTVGCILVFDHPRFDPSKSSDAFIPSCETFSRISFAPLESRIIQESSSLMKVAYMVCKVIFYHKWISFTYQLKTCLLFCMEALATRNQRETRKEDEITAKLLAFWVERIMFCHMELKRCRVYPSYFMTSFKRRVTDFPFQDENESNDIEEKEMNGSFKLFRAYNIYRDLCPDDASFDIPMPMFCNNDSITLEDLSTDPDPKWEQFDRKEFIRKLSSRSFR